MDSKTNKYKRLVFLLVVCISFFLPRKKTQTTNNIHTLF